MERDHLWGVPPLRRRRVVLPWRVDRRAIGRLDASFELHLPHGHDEIREEFWHAG